MGLQNLRAALMSGRHLAAETAQVLVDRIVCQHRTNFLSNWRICVMNADGSNPVDITADWATTDGMGRWSPDGHYLLFLSNYDGP